MNDHSETNDRLPENDPPAQDATIKDAAVQNAAVQDVNVQDATVHQHPARPATATQEPSYEAFGVWIDGELEKLVARWIHLAAPNASRPVRRRLGK
jgi:hypothetical protein